MVDGICYENFMKIDYPLIGITLLLGLTLLLFMLDVLPYPIGVLILLVMFAARVLVIVGR